MTARVLTPPLRISSGWALLEAEGRYRHVDDSGGVAIPIVLPGIASRNLVRLGASLAYVAHPSEGLELVLFDLQGEVLSTGAPLMVPEMLWPVVLREDAPYIDVAIAESTRPALEVARVSSQGWGQVKAYAVNYLEPLAMAGPIDVAIGLGSLGYPNGILRAGPGWYGVQGFDGFVVDPVTPVASDGSIALLGNNHHVWQITTTAASSVVNYDGHVGIGWTGAFWELVVSDGNGKLEERRLDAQLASTFAQPLQTTVVPTILQVGTDHDRALIVASDDRGETDLIQVCY